MAIPIPPAAAAEEEEEKAPAADNPLLALASLIIRAATMALLAYSVARAAWRARGDPWELSFIAGAGAVLAALFWCLHLAERLTPDSPAVERWRVQAGVWLLSTVLSCGFVYRVSLLMPAALVVLVWCMTAFVVLAGFYILVLRRDQRQQYQCLDEVVHTDPSGDAKPKPGNKSRPADALV